MSELKKHWKNDLIAGFVIFLIALPLSIGIALAAGAPASAGILSAILGGIVGAFIGSGHVNINGPAAGLIVVVGGAIQSLGHGDLMAGFKRMLAATIIAGSLQVITGLIQAGSLAFMAPAAVVHGMLSAIGLIIMVKQVPVLLGVIPKSKSIFGILSSIPDMLSHPNVLIAALGIATVILIVAWTKGAKKFSKSIPGPLLAVALGLIVSYCLGMDHAHAVNGQLIGPKFLVNVPTHFKELFIFPDFSIIFSTESLIAIMTIYIVASLESLLSSYAIDKLDPYKRNSDLNRDIIGKGITNICCGFLGAYPIISEIVRSSANVANGAKTKYANFFHGVFMLIFVGLFPGLINHIPLTVLAGVLFIVGFGLAHPRNFVEVYHHGKDQLLIFCTTLIITLVEDLLVGIAAGILLKIILHFARGIKVKDFVSPQIKYSETINGGVIEADSPIVFTGILKLRKIFKNIPENQKINFVENGNFIDFTIRSFIQEQIAKRNA